MNPPFPALKNPPREKYRTLCYRCFRPVASCFCAVIPTVHNRTELLILQHRAERTHPFNSGRIVARALVRSQLIIGRNMELAKTQLPIQKRVGLLYPGKNARNITDLEPDKLPRQLVLLDGTWHHARTMFRDIPQLHDLPCFRLNPAEPSRFRIREEPTLDSLSTLEATIASLSVLEPELAGLDKLLNAFDVMVDQQLRELEQRNIYQRS